MQDRLLRTRCSVRRSLDPVAGDLVVHPAKVASFPDRNAAAGMVAAEIKANVRNQLRNRQKRKGILTKTI